jgi:hypothetical protein
VKQVSRPAMIEAQSKLKATRLRGANNVRSGWQEFS